MRADVRALSAVPHVDAAELGVWPRVAEKEARIPLVDDAVAVVVDVVAERDKWRRNAELMADRYDKIRDTNLQLRDALTLYRTA